ncbi:chain-length determining protein [Castellaniella sp.]|uniref:chain-length determining protein n=1 Tax=Castellaniella sp. TaxID=1955812 RepID=UPI002AFFBE02|nr:chain-length determining protein [Castellaniella sp.]
MTDMPPLPSPGQAPTQTLLGRLKTAWFSVRIFHQLIRLTLIGMVLGVLYWSVIASDQYVSEANVVIRKTDSASVPSFDLAMLVSGVPGSNRADQLLLREYLLSFDMLQKLDQQLDLREKYSNKDHDPISRFWFKNAPAEWLYRYLLTMIQVQYDELAGTLRISAQAYDPATAQAITSQLVKDGEAYMNQLGHELANTQVEFLSHQVQLSQQQLQQASQALLNFQNKEALLSPEASAESISTIIATLEARRAALQTQLDALPRSLLPNHPNILMLKQSLKATDRQIEEERAKLTASTGGKLNATLERFQQLQLAVELNREMYKSTLMALEKGRFDATRMLNKVSVLQAPNLPEYPWEPRRIYNSFLTLLVGLMLIGVLKLLEAIVRDHVD